MSRHVIAIEGQPTVLPDTWLDKGSLWIHDEERIAVSLNFDWSQPPVGYATNLERNDETGEVSMSITLYDGSTIDTKWYECTFWAAELEERTVEATDDHPAYRLILKAHVRGIAIVGIPSYPASSQKLHGM